MKDPRENKTEEERDSSSSKPEKKTGFNKSSKSKRGGRKGAYDKERLPKDHNDASWLKSEGTLIDIASRLPLADYIGKAQKALTVVTATGTGEKVNTEERSITVPGILTISALYTAGTCIDQDSPFNLAMRKLFALLRSKTSGTIPVNVNEISIYILALGQILAMLGYLDRMLKLYRNFKVLNRYTPERLYYAMGLNYASVRDNISDLMFQVSYIKSMLGSLFMPKLDYFKNAYYVFSQVFKDAADVEQSQFYIFIPSAYGTFNPVGSEEGATLNFVAEHEIGVGNDLNALTLVSEVTKAVNALVSDEDMMNVSGFLKRTFESGDLESYSLSPLIELSEVQEPVYDAEILLQIHNAVTSSALFDHLDMNGLTIKPHVGSADGWGYYTMDHEFIVDTATEGKEISAVCKAAAIDPILTAPNQDTIIMATRLVPVRKKVPSIVRVDEAPEGRITEELVAWDVLVPTSFTVVTRTSYGVIHSEYKYSELRSDVLRITQFDFAPWITLFDSDADSVTIVGDVYNYQPVSESSLANLHTAKLLSLFTLPGQHSK